MSIQQEEHKKRLQMIERSKDAAVPRCERVQLLVELMSPTMVITLHELFNLNDAQTAAELAHFVSARKSKLPP